MKLIIFKKGNYNYRVSTTALTMSLTCLILSIYAFTILTDVYPGSWFLILVARLTADSFKKPSGIGGKLWNIMFWYKSYSSLIFLVKKKLPNHETGRMIHTYLYVLVFRLINEVVYKVTKVVKTPQKTQRNPNQYFCQHDFYDLDCISMYSARLVYSWEKVYSCSSEIEFQRCFIYSA